MGDLRLRETGENFGGKGSGGVGQRVLAWRNRFWRVYGVTLHGFPGFIFVLEAVFVFELSGFIAGYGNERTVV